MGSPRRKRHVGPAYPLRDAALALQLWETPGGGVIAGHAGVVGHRDEEGTGVEIAVLRPGVDLQSGPARVGRDDRIAVVDDALEDGKGADLHRITSRRIPA